MTPEEFAQELMKLTERCAKAGLNPGIIVGVCIGFGAGLGASLGVTRENMIAQLDEGLTGAVEAKGPPS